VLTIFADLLEDDGEEAEEAAVGVEDEEEDEVVDGFGDGEVVGLGGGEGVVGVGLEERDELVVAAFGEGGGDGSDVEELLEEDGGAGGGDGEELEADPLLEVGADGLLGVEHAGVVEVRARQRVDHEPEHGFREHGRHGRRAPPLELTLPLQKRSLNLPVKLRRPLCSRSLQQLKTPPLQLLMLLVTRVQVRANLQPARVRRARHVRPRKRLVLVNLMHTMQISISRVSPKLQLSISRVSPKFRVSISRISPKFQMSITGYHTGVVITRFRAESESS
jgi:hypothetical protein